MEKELITSYKGFNNDLSCLDLQYEVGNEYSIDGRIEINEIGFHACENPLNVLDYYGFMFDNRYCVVEQYGKLEKDDKCGDVIVSSNIRIKEEIGWDGLFKHGREWFNKMFFADKYSLNKELLNEKGAKDANVISSGKEAKITSSGEAAKIASSGYNAKITSSGESAKIVSSGNSAKIVSSGNFSQIVSDNDNATITSNGDYIKIGAFGSYNDIASSGNCLQLGTFGDNAKIALSASFSNIGANGNDTRIASNGYHNLILSNGDEAKIASSGMNNQIEANGENSVIACVGEDSVARAKVGCWITLAEWKYSEEKEKVIPVCVKSEYVDGERIKADTWYELENGEFVEVTA